MKILLVALGLVGAAAGTGYYLLTKKPAAHWQVGSILSGEDPDEGWIQEEVKEVEWRERTFFDLNLTTYEPQWWYHLAKVQSGESVVWSGWYPEEFLESVVIG